MNPERLLERFLRYVQVDTTADGSSESYPSSPGQLTLGAMIAAELREMGLQDVEHDQHGLVWGTVPATVKHSAPVVALNAHLDTSPDTSGTNVRPQVHRNWDGRDIVLPGDTSKVIRVADTPEIAGLVGKTIITTDGTTLLGSDDKSGVAVIVELANHLIEHPEIPHGPVKVLLTCDEEIGAGVKHVDIKKLGATVAYTLDGGGSGEIDVETFSADKAMVTFHGVPTHPGQATGKIVSSLRGVGMFLDRLPREMSPERTADRQGFIHPVKLFESDVEKSVLMLILRDFQTEKLADQAALLERLAREVERELPGLKIDVEISKQYRNMAEGLRREPRSVKFAEQAFQRLSRPYKLTIVRGGTDGSQLTELGLPTPNLSTGEHNIHSPLEWTCLEEMTSAVEVLTELVQLWGQERA